MVVWSICSTESNSKALVATITCATFYAFASDVARSCKINPLLYGQIQVAAGQVALERGVALHVTGVETINFRKSPV